MAKLVIALVTILIGFCQSQDDQDAICPLKSSSNLNHLDQIRGIWYLVAYSATPTLHEGGLCIYQVFKPLNTTSVAVSVYGYFNDRFMELSNYANLVNGVLTRSYIMEDGSRFVDTEHVDFSDNYQFASVYKCASSKTFISSGYVLSRKVNPSKERVTQLVQAMKADIALNKKDFKLVNHNGSCRYINSSTSKNFNLALVAISIGLGVIRREA